MRLFMVKSHVEKVDNSQLVYSQGQFYMIDEPLASELIDAGKAKTEATLAAEEAAKQSPAPPAEVAAEEHS